MQVANSLLVTSAIENQPGLASAGANKSSGNIAHAAGEFESMLLTQWLQAAEETFGSTPGTEDEQDGAALQMRSYAVQALAKGITAAGGIGLSHLVAQALEKGRSDSHDSPKSSVAVQGASTTTPAPLGGRS